MTDSHEQRYSGLIQFGRTVQTRLRALIVEIDACPPGALGSEALALQQWRVALLVMTCDISDAALTLANTRSDQMRAMQILNRSLFEYAVRLEFYAYDPKSALKDWTNAEAWLKTVASVMHRADLAALSKDELRLYNSLLRVKGKSEYINLGYMLRVIFKTRGFSKAEQKKMKSLCLKAYTI